MQQEKKGWLENRTIIIAWVVFFFPIGLYGVWKSHIFEKKTKQIITGSVVAFFVALLLGFDNLLDRLYLFILCPVAIYFLWKDISVGKTTTYIFGGVLVVFFAVYLSGGGGLIGPDPNCVGVLEQNGCTYFRDDNCVVISRVCG